MGNDNHEQMNQQEGRQSRDRKAILSIIGVLILIIGLVGVTYAFFNYTRVGAPNTINTGRIYFNAEQSQQVTLSDLFPITVSGAVTSSTPGVGSLTIHVTGDTNYEKGVEYLVKAVNVTGMNDINLPISLNVSYAANGQEKIIGEEDENYFTNRGGTTSRYKVLSSDTISEGKDLIVGYIAPGTTGVDGIITIMAYLDSRNIAITDTYPETTYYGVNNNLTQEQLNTCVTSLSSLNATLEFCNGTGTISYNSENISFQQALDNGAITQEQKTSLLNQGIISELYTDGTSSTWVNGRTVFTTEQWNALQASGVSFQIRVEANEGTWVPNPGSATLSLSPASGTININTASSTTSSITTNGNGTLSCTSSDDSIATCSITNNTLTVTGVAAGSATITVTESGGTLYSTPATANYEVTVTNS